MGDRLATIYPGASTMAAGPAGWNGVAYGCLTGDRHRNFGRGGAGAVFGSKNLVAITALGRRKVQPFDASTFAHLARKVDDLVRVRSTDRERTASFRSSTGTTWWLDRAFDGRYMGKAGGYLPWRNFQEGYFQPADYAQVGTDAFLEIAGRHAVCNRCRHVMCSRAAHVDVGPFSGEGVRPEFETIALWINCCLLDRAAIFHLNGVCNDLGLDTMTFGSVMSGAMEWTERGFLDGWSGAPEFGSVDSMLQAAEAIAYASSPLGELLGSPSDLAIEQLAGGHPAADRDVIAACATTAYAGLGYAGIEPKVFPGMFAAYATSNRGRGDHTYAWTVQAEEDGLSGAAALAAYVAESQAGKALVDSMGLCDFFAGDIASDLFMAMYAALTGVDYSFDVLLQCGRRIYALERHANARQGRTRAYDAYVPPKLAIPLTEGAHAGKAVDGAAHDAVLDAYYAYQGWTVGGDVSAQRLSALGIA
jgi:aldehyde:ferredoxin oxidoreductase